MNPIQFMNKIKKLLLCNYVKLVRFLQIWTVIVRKLAMRLQSMEQSTLLAPKYHVQFANITFGMNNRLTMSVCLPIMSIVKSLNGKILENSSRKTFGRLITLTSGCIQLRSVFQTDIKNGFYQIIRRRWQNFSKKRNSNIFERVKIEMYLILIQNWVILCEVKLIV